VLLGILERLLLVILQTNMTVHFIIGEMIKKKKKKKILLSNLIRIGNGDELYILVEFISSNYQKLLMSLRSTKRQKLP
jgi:hypothetical protein